MSPLRSDLWAGAFVRRHNDLGRICVVARRGDPVAGQIFVVLDHLNGTMSLFTPAPATAHRDNEAARVFQRRFDRAEPDKVEARIAREIDFDPDLWVLSLEMRGDEPGIEIVP
jgi:hypothetical protein